MHYTHNVLLPFTLSVAQNTRIEHSSENCELPLSLDLYEQIQTEKEV